MRTAQHETAERTRLIVGRVISDGTVDRGGSAFTVYHPSTGLYAVRWTFVAKSIVSVVASGASGTSGLWVVVDTHSGTPLGPNEFLVKCYTNAVGLADTTWHFAAQVIPACV